MSENKEKYAVAVSDQQAAVITPESNLLFDDSKFMAMQRMADVMASSELTIPVHLQKKPGDCFAICMQSSMWGMNPFAVAQKTHIVNGKLGYEAQLVNAVVKSSGAIRGIFHREYIGPWENITEKQTGGKKTWTDADEKGCGIKVWATPNGQAEPEYHELLMTQVSVRNSPNWTSNPQLQLFYLAVKQWARIYTPSAILGVYTPDEIDEDPGIKNITPQKEVKGGSTVADLKSKLGMKTAAEAEQTAEVIETQAQEVKTDKLPLSALVLAEISNSGAPITMEDITAYLITKKITAAIDKIDDIPQLAKWAEHIRLNTVTFVKAAAEWSITGK